MVDFSKWREWKKFDEASDAAAARLVHGVEPAAVPVSTPEPPKVQLSARQQRAVDLALSGRNILLTGPGGTGKSEVTRALISALRAAGKRVAVAASTGIAAVHIGGMTIHSTIGLGIASNLAEAQKQLGPNTIQKVQERLYYVDTIVIDEVSMLTGDYIQMLDWFFNLVKESNAGEFRPFGGFQMIFVGDFLQLPPVIKDGTDLKARYAFEAEAWKKADIASVYLTECYRTDDPELFKHLNRIRRGILNEETIAFFAPCVDRKLDEPTKLFPTNQQALDLNLSKLAQLDGKVVEFDCLMDGNEKWFNPLRNNCIADDPVQLKAGAPVIFLKNNYELGYINGMRGRVVGFPKAGYIEVQAADGRHIQVAREVWEMRNAENRVLASLKQYPLKLAWALTAHKSQGMSLDLVQCDLGRCFERGQSYVMLSRARSMAGLSLAQPLRPGNVRASKKCVDFYKELRAKEAEHG